MKRFLLCIYLGLFLLATGGVKAQSGVFNPADPDVVFTSTNQPAQPAWNSIAKWGHTNRLNWNPYSYGYRCYWFNGVPFRVKFPASYQHGVSDGKKYPMLIFLHGLGERGTVYDNEYQLRHGGQQHAQRVNDGSFDGFLLIRKTQMDFSAMGLLISLPVLLTPWPSILNLTSTGSLFPVFRLVDKVPGDFWPTIPSCLPPPCLFLPLPSDISVR